MNSFIKFCKAVFPIKFYLFFSFIWVYGMQCFFLNIKNISYKWDISDAYISIICFLTLLLIRSLDEIKDFEYDVVYNPNRPLVKGDITKKDLFLYAIMSSSGILILGLLTHQPVYPLTICAYIYIIFFLDKLIEKVTDNPFVTLIIVFPCSAQLYFYFADYFYKKYTGYDLFSHEYLHLVSPFILSFLSLEILRKTKPDSNIKGTYQTVTGFWFSFILGQTLALASAFLLLYFMRMSKLSVFGFIIQIAIIILNVFSNTPGSIYLQRKKGRFFSVLFLFSSYLICIVIYLINSLQRALECF